MLDEEGCGDTRREDDGGQGSFHFGHSDTLEKGGSSDCASAGAGGSDGGTDDEGGEPGRDELERMGAEEFGEGFVAGLDSPAGEKGAEPFDGPGDALASGFLLDAEGGGDFLEGAPFEEAEEQGVAIGTGELIEGFVEEGADAGPVGGDGVPLLHRC